MKLTIVGCGDAFNSYARAHTCFKLETAAANVIVDFGSSALLGWQKLNLATNDIDLIVISHLHGDHFGGLPFLLLECHYVSRRTRPLVLAGPPGFRNRLYMLMEALYAGDSHMKWHFPLEICELEVGVPARLCGLDVLTTEVRHGSGAPATAIRIADGDHVFAFSGDTGWTDKLVQVADGADLFLIECGGAAARQIDTHIDWPTLRQKAPDLRAKHKIITHLTHGSACLSPEMEEAGFIVANDGLVITV